jgi:hypothetical protein
MARGSPPSPFPRCRHPSPEGIAGRQTSVNIHLSINKYLPHFYVIAISLIHSRRGDRPQEVDK